MTDTDRQRLTAILGMLGSAHAGERDAAARQAEAFRLRHGMTWEQIIELRVIYVPTITEAVVYVDRPVAVWKEPSPWMDRLLVIGVWIGVPLGLLGLAAAFH